MRNEEWLGRLARDCVYFQGNQPCWAHKKHGLVCRCGMYNPKSRKLLLILLSDAANIIRSTAQAYNVPLWDLWSALQPLPNRGRGEDDIHLSAPMNDAKQVVDFRPENFQYGYTMRNFTALQVLNALYREVIAR